jgi:hypothetical protein
MNSRLRPYSTMCATSPAARPSSRARIIEGGTMQALYEILVILFFLACLTLVGSGVSEGWRRLLGWPGLGRGYWASLLGGMALLFLLLLALTLGGALTVGFDP